MNFLKNACKLALLSSQLIFKKIICQNQTDKLNDNLIQQPDLVLSISKVYFSIDQCEHNDLKIFQGTGNPLLGMQIASHLDLQLGRINISRFADGQVSIEVYDQVRDQKVYIIQSFQKKKINDQFIELILIIQAMKRSGANNVTVIMPYFPYCKHQQQVNFACQLAKLIQNAGADMVITLNANHKQLKGFFSPKCPLLNIDCTQLVVPFLVKKGIKDPVLVCGNIKGNKLYRWSDLGATMKMFDLQPNYGFYNYYQQNIQYEGCNVKGNKISLGRDCVIYDNIADRGLFLKLVSEDLKKKGADKIYGYSVHGLCTGEHIKEVINGDDLENLILTNTITEQFVSQKIIYLSVGKLVAQIIAQIHRNKSLASVRSQRDFLKYALIHRSIQPDQP